MSTTQARYVPFEHRVMQDLLPGYSVVHKFGHNHAVAQSYAPICAGGEWQTPQIAGAKTLRIKAGGSADDDSDGTGAREVSFECMDTNGDIVTDVLATNGVSASTEITGAALRILRAWVSKSGTYASAVAGSHAAAIVIEAVDASNDWATIPLDSFPFSRSQIGAYTVPLGYTAWITDLYVQVDSTKAVDILFFSRENILETAAPYSSMQALREFPGVSGPIPVEFGLPFGPFPALTDFGFMARVAAQTAAVSVDMAILLKAD